MSPRGRADKQGSQQPPCLLSLNTEISERPQCPLRRKFRLRPLTRLSRVCGIATLSAEGEGLGIKTAALSPWGEGARGYEGGGGVIFMLRGVAGRYERLCFIFVVTEGTESIFAAREDDGNDWHRIWHL